MIKLYIVVVLILNWNNLLMKLEDLNIKLEFQQMDLDSIYVSINQY